MTTRPINALHEAADIINRSKTGAVATVGDKCVVVKVPGIRSLTGNRTARFFGTEEIYSVRGAIRLVQSMQ